MAVTRSSEGLVRFEVPGGDGHDVRLQFTGARNDGLGIAVSLVATITAIAVVLRDLDVRVWWRRARTGDRTSVPSPR